MTEPQIGTGFADIKVETNAIPAAVEQQSTETVTTEPNVTLPADPEALEPAAEPTPDPLPEQKDNDLARDKIREQMRADDAERKLKELQPKESAPEKEPEMGDKATWGDKYKDAPYEYEHFLKAHADWARNEGRKEERSSVQAENDAKEQAKIRANVATKVNESRLKHTDFDAVINQDAVQVIGSVPILKDFLAKSPMGTEVMYELFKNPAVLDQIMRADNWEASERLINIAARLKKPPAAKITSAPEPIKPVGSRETVQPKMAELASTNVGAYIAKANKQELARKRSH